LKAVLDVNVIISGLLAPSGSPARLLRLWIEGAFDLVCSPGVLEELQTALTYPKLRARISNEEATELLHLLTREALIVDDPGTEPDVSSRDPGDNYLIALAVKARAVIVSGDNDLLLLSPRIPVYAPAEFLTLLEEA